MKLILGLLAALFVTGMHAQSAFEGTIELEEKKGSSTLKLVYTVKGKMVRIDTYTPEGELKGARIIDTENKIVLALMPSRKLYFQVPVRPLKTPEGGTFKPDNIKGESLGFTTWNADVSNPELGRNANLVMMTGNFAFFVPLTAALGPDDSFSFCFTEANNMNNCFPARVTETRQDGALIMTRTTTAVTPATVDPAVFDVPADYSLMER
jgi:hypothetical protein